MKEIKVKAGDKVKVGQAILSYEESNGAAASPKAADAKAAPAKAAPVKAEEKVADIQPDVQVKDQSTVAGRPRLA